MVPGELLVLLLQNIPYPAHSQGKQVAARLLEALRLLLDKRLYELAPGTS